MNQAKHKQKYQENKLFYAHLPEVGNYLDWKATVLFYCAVHLIEGKLAEKGIDSKNHKDRHEIMEQDADMQDIIRYYKTLYLCSMVARYDIGVSKMQVNWAVSCLREIEKRIVIT